MTTLSGAAAYTGRSATPPATARVCELAVGKTRCRFGRRDLGALLGAVWALLLVLAGQWAYGQELLIKPDSAPIPLWPHVRVLEDPTGTLTIEQALTQRQRFAAPARPYANFGQRKDAVWLHIRFSVANASAPQRWLAIDYPPLDRVDMYLMRDQKVVQQVVLGDSLSMAERPVALRPHATALDLQPGAHYELFLRVRTTSTMIVPLTIESDGQLVSEEAHFALLQGIAFGLALCMTLYTLLRFLLTREPLLLWFASCTAITAAFILAYFGYAAIYLWPDNAWLISNSPLLLILLTLAAGMMFIDCSLRMPEVSPKASKAMRLMAAAAAATAGFLIADAISYYAAALTSTVLGIFPVLVAIPVAIRRIRQADRAAGWMLAGWLAYGSGVACLTGIGRGALPYHGWLPYAYQIGCVVQLFAWVMVLGIRAEQLRRSALAARRDHDRVMLIAHTDALTGLLNRRGLQIALDPIVSACRADSLVAIYVLDLDGFKRVNDDLGHDAGDRVLAEIARRLRAALRADDLIARVGGDEFVVVAPRLRSDAEAAGIGAKLLDCTRGSFELAGAIRAVGMTVGYAVAPGDGHDMAQLLKRADAAMYQAKKAGKNRVTRIHAERDAA